MLPFAQLTLKHGWDGIEERKQHKRIGLIESHLQHKDYTLEHFYAVRCIEMHMIRLLVNVRRKRGE